VARRGLSWDSLDSNFSALLASLGDDMRGLLLASLFVLVVFVSPAQAQGDACVSACLQTSNTCQSPCFATRSQCRAACGARDRKCMRACQTSYRACIKPCLADTKRCAAACRKR
jgi:hypothetical protein